MGTVPSDAGSTRCPEHAPIISNSTDVRQCGIRPPTHEHARRSAGISTYFQTYPRLAREQAHAVRAREIADERDPAFEPAEPQIADHLAPPGRDRRQRGRRVEPAF